MCSKLEDATVTVCYSPMTLKMGQRHWNCYKTESVQLKRVFQLLLFFSHALFDTTVSNKNVIKLESHMHTCKHVTFQNSYATAYKFMHTHTQKYMHTYASTH